MTRTRPQLIRHDDQQGQTGQTSGMVRREAIHTDQMWAGTVHNAAGLISGWHHHGRYESAIYVVNGDVRLESGPGGKTVLEAGPGDFLWVPAGEIHREGSLGTTAAEIVVVRAGQGEIVVNVDGPEPD